MMKSATMAASPALEYTLYVFDKITDPARPTPRWEKNATLTSLAEAQSQADALFRSGAFHKIEIKQKLFDKKKNRNIDVTLQVLEAKSQRQWLPLEMVLAFILTAACGSLAFAAGYILAHG